MSARDKDEQKKKEKGPPTNLCARYFYLFLSLLLKAEGFIIIIFFSPRTCMRVVFARRSEKIYFNNHKHRERRNGKKCE